MVEQKPVWVSWSGGIGAPTTIPLKGGKRSSLSGKRKTRKQRKGRKATRKARKGKGTRRR